MPRNRPPGVGNTFDFGDEADATTGFGTGNPLADAASPEPPMELEPPTARPATWATPVDAPASFGRPTSGPSLPPASPFLPPEAAPADSYDTPGVEGTALLIMAGGAGRDALAGALGSAGLSVLVCENPLTVASSLYGLRPSVVLVDAAHGPAMAAQSVQWLRLSGLNAQVVCMGNMQPGFVDQLTRAGVAHCVPYPSDVAVFATQLVGLLLTSQAATAPSAQR